jgi:hypothetical protein
MAKAPKVLGKEKHPKSISNLCFASKGALVRPAHLYLDFHLTQTVSLPKPV